VRRGVAPVAGLIGASWIGENASAEIPSQLLQTTVRTALRVATRRVTVGSVSPSVLSLTEGVISTMLMTKVKLSAGALLIGGSLVSLGAFFASPGHRAIAQFTQETRSVRPNPGASTDQVLKARLEESTALAAKLQREVQDLQAELQALRTTARQSSGSPPASKVPPSAFRRSATSTPDHREAIDVQPNPPATASNVSSPFSADRSVSPEDQHYRRFGGLIFAASPTGNRVIAYDPSTRWTSSLELHATKDNPLKVSFAANPSFNRMELVALRIEGEHITRIAAFDLKSRTWRPQDLSEPVRGQAMPYVANGISYDLGRHLYTFNVNSLSWDHLDVGAIGDAPEGDTEEEAKRVK
jgi:hypothetical protein